MTIDLSVSAAQRLDLRRVDIDDIVDRVQKTLALRLDAADSIRKRRTIGARSDRGTWVRIECVGMERLTGQGSGTEASLTLPQGVPRPAWLSGLSWHDPDRAVVWRVDETTLVETAPIGRAPNAAGLPDSWWTALSTALDALAGHQTSRISTPDCLPISPERLSAAIGAVFPDVDTALPAERTCAHADLNWSNLCGPALAVLDWEDHGSAPRGLDAANLWFSSLSVPEVAARVAELRRDDLESRSGRLMALWRCAEFMAWGSEEPLFPVVKGAAEQLVIQLKR